ncbi:hypothetical protein [Massilia timonae]|uniref:Uncharacterized protein n=1 Tax=Massilia timonae TaxID=47229 RepID=A0A1S2N8P3_9BURK|nr:hypothetical protein [Massilia timonae]OIJ40994.1 hypothetical protein LO55_5047 [Massilia timonae]
MQQMPEHEYRGYTIVARVWPTPGNRYQSAVTVLSRSPSAPPGQLAIRYHEPKERGMSCETAHEADQDALERARFWIDAQPD